MKIELHYSAGVVTLGAVHDECGLVAHGKGAKLADAAKDLVSKFAKYQADTIDALNASGIIHYVKPESLS